MSVYGRYKKDPEGLRRLVELLESTPVTRRQKMIEVGMEEDSTYTQTALQYVLNFQDVLDLPDLELTEVLSETPARFSAFAIAKMSPDVKERFLRKAPPKIVADLKENLDMAGDISNSQVGGAQMKLIETTRRLERKGLIRTKRIPVT